ncbi:hypothetical protein Pelo_19559 [Pelomyxa schiedti]|nr:hypothetical protein Pelo_19559 [Pelomyxa schiedti]
MAQRDVIRQLEDTDYMKPGDTWFLISTPWFNQWKCYVMYDNPTSFPDEEEEELGTCRPGPISNSYLLEEDGNLKPFATETYDYDLVGLKSLVL